MSLVELVLITIIPFFIMIIANKNILNERPSLKYIYDFFELNGHNELVFAMAFISFIVIILGNIALLLFNYKLTHFSMMLGHEFSSNLYRYYLQKDFLYHTKHSAPKLIENINKEVSRIYLGIFNPFMLLNSKLFLSIALLANLFFQDPKLTLIISGSLIFIYFLIFKFVKNILKANGRLITKENIVKMSCLTESFHGAKEVKFLSLENYFYRKYFAASLNTAIAFSKNALIATSPRFILEGFAFGGMTLVIIYLTQGQASLESVLPTLSLYALTGHKLMPAVNQVYSSLSSVKANINAFHSVQADLSIANQNSAEDVKFSHQKVSAIKPHHEIKLTNINFKYPTRDEHAVSNLNITIPIGKKVAFVGPSGSGKTTTIDILLGLITPQSGEITYDSTLVTPANLEKWKKSIGYVPQSIFLVDSSIEKNIFLGNIYDEFNTTKFEKSIVQASLTDFIKSLKDHEKTLIGEKGALLSGGQKQRVGLARAFYRDSSIIVLDEATSALDNITESQITAELQNLSVEKTLIIIAHRLSTVKDCDIIYFFEAGEVVAQGNYQQLYLENKKFKQLVDCGERG